MSLRWRLSISYAAISLLAILSLGIVLFVSLQSFYRQQESNYLDGNAEALSHVMESLLVTELATPNVGSLDFVQSAIDTYAFLLQAQITLLDREGAILITSQAPETLQADTDLSLNVRLGDIEQRFGQRVEQAEDGIRITSFYALQGSQSAVSAEQTVNGALSQSFASPLALMETPGLSQGLINPAATTRSSYVTETQLFDMDDNHIGTLQLSNGPALGQQVLRLVRISFALAGGIAILLSIVTGAFLTGQISEPIRSLAATTTQMAEGNLAVRTSLRRKDEIGQLASAFNEMVARVELLVVTLRRFVADAAHELNTPLTAMRTNLELARRSPENQLALDRAWGQLERLTQLCNNLLDLSRLEAGVTQPKMAPLDFRELVARRAEYYAARAEQAALELIVNLPDEPLSIVGNNEQLSQVLDNLLDNAVKFTPAGGHLTLTLSRDTSQAILTLTDTGIGLGGADPAQLRQRFTRGDNVNQTNGSGLGLAIVDAALQTHHGQLELYEEKTGTKAIVTLPI